MLEGLDDAGQASGRTDEQWDAIALDAVRAARAAGEKVPGLGHPVHKEADPRVPVMFAIAEDSGSLGDHLRLFAAVGRVHEQVLGRRLPLNGAGVAGAALADLGLPIDLLRAFALLARTAGLIGHLAEERVTPIGPTVYAEVDRNAVYIPLPGDPDRAFDANTSFDEGASMARLSAVLATTHHPFYLKATQLTPPEERMPQADEWRRKVEAYRETLTAAQPDVLVMVGADHFHQFFADNYPAFLIGKQPMYDATFYNEEREFSIPRYLLQGHEELSGFLLQGLLDRGFDLAVSHELKLDHSIICPIITTRPDADLPGRPDLHEHLRATPAQPEALLAARPGDPRGHRRVAERPDRRRGRLGPSLPRARWPASVRRDGPGPGLRPPGHRVAVEGQHRGDPRERHVRVDVGRRQRDPRLHGPDPHDGHRRADRGVVRRRARPLPHPGDVPDLDARAGGGERRMSKYYVNKFLYQVDGDPDLLAAYKADPAGPRHPLGGRVRALPRGQQPRGADDLAVVHGRGAAGPRRARLRRPVRDGRALLPDPHDHDRPLRRGLPAVSGPLSFQREYAAKLSHWLGQSYPPVAL